MRISTLFFYLPLIAAATAAKAGEGIDYFGCPDPPADRPVVFAPGKVSRKSTWEEKIAFTPEGSEMFFGRHPDAGANYRKSQVMHAKYEKGQWSTPEVASFSIGRQVGWPLLCEQGTRLFLEEHEGKIVFLRKKEHGWSEPERLLPDVDAEQGFGLGQTTDDGTLYFHDRWARIAYSTKKVDGEYTKPEPLSYKINPCVEFFVSPQNDYIIFQPLNWGNQFHISFRNANGEWDMPISFAVHFGRNSEWDLKGIGPSVSPDGKYLFFGKRGDIHWIKADFIAALRVYERPY